MNETFNSLDEFEEEDKVQEIKEKIAVALKDNLKLLYNEGKTKNLARKAEEDAKNGPEENPVTKIEAAAEIAPPTPVPNPEENKEMDKKEEESADWFKDAGVDLGQFLDPRENIYGLDDIMGKFPKGVAPTRKEAYLTNDVFKKTFYMTKKDFYALKTWRQDKLKKSTGIFWNINYISFLVELYVF